MYFIFSSFGIPVTNQWNDKVIFLNKDEYLDFSKQFFFNYILVSSCLPDPVRNTASLFLYFPLYLLGKFLCLFRSFAAKDCIIFPNIINLNLERSDNQKNYTFLISPNIYLVIFYIQKLQLAYT